MTVITETHTMVKAPELSTLGNSSHVNISAETLSKANGTLTFRRKQELRQEAVMAYIKSKPFGARITDEEFKNIAHFNNVASTYAFIKRMVRDQMIAKENITPRTYSYRVIGDDGQAKVTRPAKLRLTPPEVEEYAMRFSWQQPDQQNDLRGFVAWLKDQKKEPES